MIEETTLSAVPVTGLVGRWAFNEGAGTNVSDISGNGRHGINAQANGWSSAVLGSGLKSVAGAPQVSVPHHSSLALGNVMTVTFWMRKNAEGTSRLVGKGSSSTVENYGVWTDSADGKLRFKFYSGSGAQSATGTSALSQNQWYHVAVTLNATTGAGSVKFYLDGVLNGSSQVTGLPVTSSDPLTIGYAGYASGFSGDMDDVCVYNRELSASEISSLADRTGTGVTCRYTLGTQLISQERRSDGSSSDWTGSYYGHDGLGSTRALYDASGVATDTYNYTAYGKMMVQLYVTTQTQQGPQGTPTVNNYLFAGEQWDPDLKLYYNRARYLNVDSGRFTSRDTFDGGAGDIANLHRYLYVGGDPINGTDPSGHDGILGITMASVYQFSLRGLANVAASVGVKYATSALLHQDFDYGWTEFAWDFVAGGAVGIGNDIMGQLFQKYGSTMTRIALYGGQSAGQGLIATSEWTLKKKALDGQWPSPQSFVRVWAGSSVISAIMYKYQFSSEMNAKKFQAAYFFRSYLFLEWLNKPGSAPLAMRQALNDLKDQRELWLNMQAAINLAKSLKSADINTIGSRLSEAIMEIQGAFFGESAKTGAENMGD